jgi:hypothetical protein
VRTLDRLAWSGDLLSFVKAPRQHGRKDFGRVEQGFFNGTAFGEGVGQVDKLDQEAAVRLGLYRRRVSNVHHFTSLQSDTRLPLYRCEKAGANIP